MGVVHAGIGRRGNESDRSGTNLRNGGNSLGKSRIRAAGRVAPQEVVVLTPRRGSLPCQAVTLGEETPQILIFQISLIGDASEKYQIRKGRSGSADTAGIQATGA